jgi:hypothetical protein
MEGVASAGWVAERRARSCSHGRRPAYLKLWLGLGSDPLLPGGARAFQMPEPVCAEAVPFRCQRCTVVRRGHRGHRGRRRIVMFAAVLRSAARSTALGGRDTGASRRCVIVWMTPAPARPALPAYAAKCGGP